jgi:hypothetical protein
MENPIIGDTIAGTGGLKKFRMPDASRGKGKRGGLRVIYLDLPDKETTYLLFIYGKDEADDLTATEKKIFKELVSRIKGENK